MWSVGEGDVETERIEVSSATPARAGDDRSNRDTGWADIDRSIVKIGSYSIKHAPSRCVLFRVRGGRPSNRSYIFHFSLAFVG
jgi:hypothetical protein